MSGRIGIHDLIRYVIALLTDMEADFGKTKLVKLLYLIDIENFRRYSSQLTNFEWCFYHYGPYAPAIDKVLEQLHLDIPQEETTTRSGHKSFIFKPLEDAESELEEQMPSAAKSVISKVLDEWGLEELNPILSYVYFHTEPMISANRGDTLDFTKVHRPVLQTTKIASATPTDQLQKMKEEFSEAKINYFKYASKSLYPSPRFDDVFISGLKQMDDEEKYYLPRGDVFLDEDSKAVIKYQPGFENIV